jgi:hypothetical protein
MTNNDTTTATVATTIPVRIRRNMNHSDCDHAATTDARTACRDAAKSAGTWPMPAPVTASPDPVPVHFTIGRGRAVHNGGGDSLDAMCGVIGVRNGTDDAVTCKNCLKLM